MKKNTKEFFESIVSEYDEVFKKLVSPFPEMIWTMFNYLPDDFQPLHILELGCGTGNLTKAVSHQWPESHITVVDLSLAMLEKTQSKTEHTHLKTIQSSFTDLNFEEQSFDFVTSSLAIHHLLDDEKQILIKNVHKWLKPGGVFMFNDCVRAQSERLYNQANKHWIDLALNHGLSQKDMKSQIEHHQTHDHYPTLIELANWLENTGFQEVDILWKFCIWAVLCGRKNS